MKNHEARWLIRARNALCALYLILLVLSEAYSAAATALDHSNRFPAWEAKLGLCLFVLPCLLVTGLFFLLRGERETMGFSLVGLSLLLYLAFMFLEDALSPERMVRGEWLFNGFWIMLCAAGTGAAWILKRRHRSEPSEQPPDRQ
jgi:hypothetical protein